MSRLIYCALVLYTNYLWEQVALSRLSFSIDIPPGHTEACYNSDTPDPDSRACRYQGWPSQVVKLICHLNAI